MKAAEPVAQNCGVQQACRLLGISRATWYRRRNPVRKLRKSRPASHRALSGDEQEKVLSVLLSEKYAERPVRQVYFDLLSNGIYLASLSTMYRILRTKNLILDKRNQRRHQVHKKPVLVAEAPNQVWTWDITMLKGPVVRENYFLTVLIDMFSRYVTGWMLSSEATALSCQHLFMTAADRQSLDVSALTLHSDRGPQMKCSTWNQLVNSLGLNRSFSRPRVSNDNPFVESHFKTLKYQPEYPGRFDSLEDARGFCQQFFRWYNEEHYHSGIADLTPYSVHHGVEEAVLNTRQQALENGYLQHPERFARPPVVSRLPQLVGINLDQEVGLPNYN